MDIQIVQGNILDQRVDALVSPAHSTGYMGYGAAKAIVKAGGKEIEDDAVAQAPLIIGDAIATTAGSLPFKAIIHTATIDNANDELTQTNITKAVLGALLLADDAGYFSVALPGMGTGVAGMSYDMAAQAMRDALKVFKPRNVEKVVLVDLSEEMVESWKMVLGR